MRIDLARPDQVNGTAHRDRDAELPTMTWSAWSCTVRLVVEDADALEPAAADVMAFMRRVDAAASRFRNDSDLSWANLNHGRPTAVSRLLIELLDGALEGARRTHGALDPTLERTLRELGYDRDILLIADRPAPARPPLARSTHRSGRWRDIVVDRETGLLTVPFGAGLDLGATAKAQAADLAAHAVRRRYGCSAMVEIGGDLAVAGEKTDWQVLVAERAGQPGQQVQVARGGLATSTVTIRRWSRDGMAMHHIVDPRTGLPATGPWRTVSVAADSALLANVCSTASIVQGEAALSWLATQPVAARLVHADGSVVRIGGWPC